MTTSKKVLLVVFALEAIIVGVCVNYALNVEKKSPKISLAPSAGHMSSVIRLHQVHSGFFTCSGTVVSSTRIVTAAHCLGGGMFGLPTTGFEVRGSDSLPRGIYAKVEGADFRSDQAVLSGNFTMFDTRHLQTNPAEIIKRMVKPGRKVIVCGYPYAGPLFCSPFTDINQWSFQFTGRGYMFPGMSGGPVFDIETGEVLGVNTGVMSSQDGDTRLVISPTINTYNDTNSKE